MLALSFRRVSVGFLLIVIGVQSGCMTLDLNLDRDAARKLAKLASFGSESQVSLRKSPKNPLTESLNLIGWGGPKPTARTEQVLRRFDLQDAYEVDPEAALLDLHQRQIEEPSLEKLHALAQLSYIQAEKAAARSKDDKALDLYASTIVYAYRYLFDPQFNRVRNEFDPEFRSSSELYNVALEGLLRQLKQDGTLRPGYTNSLSAIGHRIDFTITLQGPWHGEDFERFEFASDYEVNGLNNTYHTYGLGVPLIAVRKGHAAETPEEQYYPKNLTFPVTAFLRVLPTQQITGDAKRDFQHCAIELHDPMRQTKVELAGRNIPLESDITTPLAYYLNDPLVSTNTVATLSLLNAEFGKNFRGLYMLEPYDPNRIPVVMVHGLWSSPVTWMEMFNDLRALPEIRENYQFWFYMYPTGQPFWMSADQMREDLAKATQILDPYQPSQMIQQMVLVGHSMGGLVSRMQTVYSEDDFWSIMSEYPIDDLKADEATREKLAGMWFFEPNPSVRRVITIGTPHRGSEFANSTTKWLGRSFFTLPQMLLRSTEEVIRDNPSFFQNTELITMTTSVDSLAPDSPVLPVLLAARSAPWVTYHNIVGVNPNKPVLAKIGVAKRPSGDGVVSVVSATMDNAASVVEVPASHTTLHQHPRAILEVRRILLEHLGRVKNDRTWDPKLLPAGHTAETTESTASTPAADADNNDGNSNATEDQAVNDEESLAVAERTSAHVAISDMSSRQQTLQRESRSPSTAALPTTRHDDPSQAGAPVSDGNPVESNSEAAAEREPTPAEVITEQVAEDTDVTAESTTPSDAEVQAASSTDVDVGLPNQAGASVDSTSESSTPSEKQTNASGNPNRPAATAAGSSIPAEVEESTQQSSPERAADESTIDAEQFKSAEMAAASVQDAVHNTAPASDAASKTNDASPSDNASQAYPSTGLPPIQVPSESGASSSSSSLPADSSTTDESLSLDRWSLFSSPPGNLFDVSEEQLRGVDYHIDTSNFSSTLPFRASRSAASSAADIRSTTGTSLRAPNVFVGRPARFDAPLPQQDNVASEAALEPGFVDRREANDD